MNVLSTTLVKRHRQWIFGTLISLTSGLSYAQVPVDENDDPLAYSEQGSDTGLLVEAPAGVVPASDLEALVGPIALYPDDLLAIVLPASTYPLEIVQAARFLELLETNSELQPDDEWDESVVALLNYPDVIKLMNDDIDWTWKLGDAVIGQQSDVIAAIEAFRDRAYAAGNLKSDDRQTVSYDEGIIEIVPVSEEIIYVPYYEPAQVVVQQPRPVYNYYPNPYPSYYYPYPAGHHFRSNYFWGVSSAYSIGWSNNYLNVYHPSYWGHPYYGHSYNYYGNYYRHPSISVHNTWYVNNNQYSSGNHYRDGARWSPRAGAGSRPAEPRVTNRHYPPGTDVRRRQSNAGRSSLDNRDNGRLNLALRERSNADRSRIAATSRGARAQPDRLTNGQSRSDRNTAPARTQNSDAGGQRTGSNRTTDAARAEVDRSNRDRVSPDSRNRTQTRSTNDANRSRTQTRANTDTSRGRTQTRANNNVDRNAIQLRDRGSENWTTNSTARAPAPNRNRTTNGTRQSSGASTSRPRVSAPVQQRSPSTRPTNRGASAPTRSSAPRASSPTRTVSPRSSAPNRSTAPRATAPSRSTAPRAPAPTRSAPQRSSAPRAPAPTRSAPQRTSAPRVSSSPSNQSSGNRGASNRSSGRRGSSRPRNND